MKEEHHQESNYSCLFCQLRANFSKFNFNLQLLQMDLQQMQVTIL
jgi:hypothetical protein